jgi:hypothetical protein
MDFARIYGAMPREAYAVAIDCSDASISPPKHQKLWGFL